MMRGMMGMAPGGGAGFLMRFDVDPSLSARVKTPPAVLLDDPLPAAGGAVLRRQISLTMGPGMMGWGYQQPRDLNLSANNVKTQLERSLAASGNVRVKVGPVKEQDANIVVADIATVDRGVLVERYQVDRHTGSWQPLR